MAPVTARLLVGACVGDEPSAPVETLPDGGVEAGSPEASALPDAAADAADTADAAMPRCDPNKPFGAPALVSGLSTADDDSTARLSADELTVFFARGVAGAGVPDIYTATRASRDAGWGVATMVSGSSSWNFRQRRTTRSRNQPGSSTTASIRSSFHRPGMAASASSR